MYDYESAEGGNVLWIMVGKDFLIIRYFSVTKLEPLLVKHCLSRVLFANSKKSLRDEELAISESRFVVRRNAYFLANSS